MPVGGFFYSRCLPTHISNDDPIVFPGIPGAAHEHQFFGKLELDAHSTAESLVGRPSSCKEQDGGTYWVPTLYLNGQRVDPVDVNVRYGLGPTSAPDKLIAFPPGFVLIAGGTRGTVQWNVKPPRRPPVAKDEWPFPTDREQVTCNIIFPDLVKLDEDGQPMIDSPNHRSHCAYSKRGVVPEGYAVIPQLQLKVHYPRGLPAPNWVEPEHDGHDHDEPHAPVPDVCLSDGHPLMSMHADFMNTWTQDRLEQVVEYCIRGRRNCGEVAVGEPFRFRV